MKKMILYPILTISFVIWAQLCMAQSEVLSPSSENNPFVAFRSSHIRDTKPAVLHTPRKDDITWSLNVWRKVDFGKKFNQFFYYPINNSAGDAQLGLRSFTDILWTAVQDGTITAYSDDTFKEALTPQQVQQKFNKVKITQRSEYNEDLGYEVDKIDTIREEFRKENVTSMEIAEVWYIDKQRAEQAVRIYGFSLSVQEYRIDELGEQIPDGVRDVFWISYNDPAVRQLLATEEVFNESNDSFRRSYDDVFIQRYFDSYIVKSSNVQDRRITNYLTGVDALLKADEIKKEIMEKEIDMWEY